MSWISLLDELASAYETACADKQRLEASIDEAIAEAKVEADRTQDVNRLLDRTENDARARFLHPSEPWLEGYYAAIGVLREELLELLKDEVGSNEH
jgi:hypothetical protein